MRESTATSQKLEKKRRCNAHDGSAGNSRTDPRVTCLVTKGNTQIFLRYTCVKFSANFQRYFERKSLLPPAKRDIEFLLPHCCLSVYQNIPRTYYTVAINQGKAPGRTFTFELLVQEQIKLKKLFLSRIGQGREDAAE